MTMETKNKRAEVAILNNKPANNFIIQHGEYQISFFELLNEYIEKHIIEASLKPQTVKHVRRYQRNIESYFIQSGLHNIIANDVKVKHMEGLRVALLSREYIRAKRDASRHVELCQRVMKYGHLMEHITNNAIAFVKNQRDPVKMVVSLSDTELKLLIETGFNYKPMQRALDLFLFQCHTGLSYSDLYRFTIEERNCKKWLINKRVKTDTLAFIPVFEVTQKLLDKYSNKLPFMHNSDYNHALKSIAEAKEIKKNLTSHVGRKTFASLMDQKGMSTKTIAEILGNTVRVCEVHYLSKSTHRVEKELDRLGISSIV